MPFFVLVFYQVSIHPFPKEPLKGALTTFAWVDVSPSQLHSLVYLLAVTFAARVLPDS